MDSLFDILLGKSLSGGGGGGGGGTSNYNALENKPQINGTTLTGNKSLSDLGIAAASDIPTVNNGTLTIQRNGTLVNTFKANQSADVTVNITVPTTASDVSALPSSTKYAAALSLSINSSTYVVTGQLKDQNGNNLGSAQTIDLPLETMVVGGSYDADNKKIVLTLKNGNTVDIPVADLVSGLQTELSVTNKLDPAFINYDSTHAAVTDTEKTTWSGKQDALTFDGTYSASTNKAATVSTVTNAINALDVTGASGISAAKTISAWSETDGKVSVSTQDIAITGTQAVLTGYQKSTTAGQAVAATDNVNQAIGKLEATVDDNKNNILSAYGGEHKNLSKDNSQSATRWIEPEMDNLYPAGNYVLYCGTITSADTTATTCAVVALAADKSTTVSTTVQINRSNGSYIAFTANNPFKYVRIYASSTDTASTGKSVSATDIMVCTAADWATSQSYAEHIMTNAELTEEINPTQFTVPTIPTGAHATLESGGYTVTGNIVIVNMRLRFSQAITSSFTICESLPIPLADSSLAANSSIAPVNNNKGLPLALNTAGAIIMPTGATMPAEMVLISCVYVKA